MTWNNESHRHALASRGIKSTIYQPFKARGNQKINKAINFYGTTDDPLKGGFILPNGELLDFSRGENIRSKEHDSITRDIGISLTDFINTGAIRLSFWDYKAGADIGLELIHPMTTSQKRFIGELYKDYNPNKINIDLITTGLKYRSLKFDGFDSIGKIFNEIDKETMGLNV